MQHALLGQRKESVGRCADCMCKHHRAITSRQPNRGEAVAPADAAFSVDFVEGCAVDLFSASDGQLDRMPHVLRILLENVVRCGCGPEAEEQRAAVTGWLANRTGLAEIAFRPARVLMHDTTCGPALVDIAGMRDRLAEAGLDPSALNPVLPVDVSTDHSIAVDRFAQPGAIRFNETREFERNGERFRLMKWAERELDGFRVHPPGTGILHTINLEQLATIVVRNEVDGIQWLYPDTLIGTDSHTPMINGLGVLGWGVGGLEAEGVMFGMPVMMRVPDVIGVRLTGALPEGTLATDLALYVTHRLRSYGVSGQFVEFFGPGVSSLSVGERAVVANMAPEYGAQTAHFPVDGRSIDYLRATGRSEGIIRRAETYCRKVGLWFDPEGRPAFTDVLEIDLSSVSISIAGPKRPQDLLAPADARGAIEPLIAARRSEGPESSISESSIPDGAVAIAAITSCTNTTDPRLTLAAGLLARKARAKGLKPPAWVKTSFSPGSPAAARYLERAGLLDDLAAVGFEIVGFGCMTCIGNSGALVPEMEAAIRQGVVPVAILSGNRNFPGRVHPQLEAAFLASPPLTVAYAIAGDVNRDILTDPVGQTADGTAVHLSDLWPSGAEIDAAFAAAGDAMDFPTAFAEARRNRLWQSVEAPAGATWPWGPGSTYLRRPPFTRQGEGSGLGRFEAYPMLVLGDDVTTDQISPAGAIPPDSETERWLIEAGEAAGDLNVYAARRGNFEAMVRGLYTNFSVVNRLAPDIPPGTSVDPETGEILPLHRLAARLEERGLASVIVAGERYGAGSSRDWAAKGAALLGVRAVLAGSFERIHRTNLIGMGILPLRLPEGVGPDGLGLTPGHRIEIEVDARNFRPRADIPFDVRDKDGHARRFVARAEVETQLEVRLLQSGGFVSLLLSERLGAASLRELPGGGSADLPKGARRGA